MPPLTRSLTTWQRQGVYRVLDIGHNSINWESEDPEYREERDQAQSGGLETQGVRAAKNTLDTQPPKVLIAIIDCGVSPGFYKIRGKRESSAVTPGLEKERQAKENWDRSKQELDVASHDFEQYFMQEQSLQRDINALDVQIKEVGPKRFNNSLSQTERDQAKLDYKQLDTQKMALKKQLSTLQKDPDYAQKKEAYQNALRNEGQIQMASKDAISGRHGTFCAAKAAWGAKEIEILDLRMFVGHGGGYMNPDELRDQIEWGLEQGCRIFSCSAIVPFLEDSKGVPLVGPTISEFLTHDARAKESLFVFSAGNEVGVIPKTGESRPSGMNPPKAPNVIWAAGCTRDAKIYRMSRWGDVEVHVPGGYFPQYDPNPDLQGGGSANQMGTDDTTQGLKGVDEWEPSDAPVPTHKMDLGVSFGVPMVANVAAKCRLINPDLKGPDLAKIIIETAQTAEQEKTEETRRIVIHMMDPAAAYHRARELVPDSGQGASSSTGPAASTSSTSSATPVTPSATPVATTPTPATSAPSTSSTPSAPTSPKDQSAH